jgi:formylmethanofuran dehydrogenase subunit C
MISLTLRVQPDVPLEAGVVTPDHLTGKSAAEIAALPVVHGNEQVSIGDFFEVEVDGSGEVVLNGDLGRVKNLGAGMALGNLHIHGNAGMHLGAGMCGGSITVHGNAGDWVGAEMKGGKIHVHGNAGHGIGGAYRGSRYGMNRGMIIVDGDVGNEAGAAMRRGLIVIGKNTGDFTGAFMIAGSIVVFGKLGSRAGAGMLRGTIVTFKKPELLPTYRYDCSYNPSFLGLIFESLRARGISVPDSLPAGCFHRYSGDFNRLGKGEILVYDQR